MSGFRLRITWMLPILLLACLRPSVCTAQDAGARDGRWVRLGSSTDPRVYLDSSRVEITDGKHMVWLWLQRTAPVTSPVDPAPAWGMRTRHRLDCAARLAEEVEMLILRDREGAQLDTISLNGSRRKSFAEHPLGQNVLPQACAWLSRHRPVGGGEARTPGAWTEFHRADRMVISVDTSRVIRAGRGVELWLRFDAATPIEGETPGQAYSRMDLRQRVDCEGDSARSVWMRLYDREGRLILDDSTDNPSTISGHPLGPTLYAEICGWLARRSR